MPVGRLLEPLVTPHHHPVFVAPTLSDRTPHPSPYALSPSLLRRILTSKGIVFYSLSPTTL